MVAKEKMIILDSMKGHLIPHIAGKSMMEMYDALVLNSSKLWHRCFGHLHYGALPLLKYMV